MASSQEIETSLIADARLRLTNASITTHMIEGTNRKDAVSFPIIAVGVQELTPDIISGPGQVPGFYRATVLLDCLTHVDDDLTGAVVRALAKDVRGAFLRDDIVTIMNTLSINNTYYTFQADAATSDTENRIRHLSIPFTSRMRPSN